MFETTYKNVDSERLLGALHAAIAAEGQGAPAAVLRDEEAHFHEVARRAIVPTGWYSWKAVVIWKFYDKKKYENEWRSFFWIVDSSDCLKITIRICLFWWFFGTRSITYNISWNVHRWNHRMFIKFHKKRITWLSQESNDFALLWSFQVGARNLAEAA